MPTPRSTLTLLVATVTLASAVFAERPLREARSEDGGLRLRITPGRGADRPARATLVGDPRRADQTETRGARRARGTLWEGPLVNDIAPERVFIRDDGQRVVTFGEFRKGGARHAIVIYAERGTVLKEHGLNQVLGGDDWSHVRKERRAIVWLNDAELRFSSDGKRFEITTAWRRQIAIDMQTGELLNAPAGAEIPPDFAALIETPQIDVDPNAADEAAPTDLDELLRLAANLFGDAEDLNAPADPNVLEGMLSVLEGETLETAGAEALADEMHASEPRDANGMDIAEAPDAKPDPNAAARNSPFDVPPPSLTDPVDYVAWTNSTLEPSDPEALALYDSAIATMLENKWEGPDELFDRAMQGDPDALASPEIQDWLAANADALAALRAASHLEVGGRPLTPSEDGMMLSVLLPQLSPLRTIAKMSVIEGRQLENAGQPQAAIGLYMDTLVAGAHTGKGPTLIENLVGVAMQALATETMLDTFERDNGAIDYDAVIADWDARADQRVRSLSKTIQFERAMSLDVMQHIFERIPETGQETLRLDRLGMVASLSDGDSGLSQMMLGLNINRLGVEGNAAILNHYYDGMTTAFETPWVDARPIHADLEQRISTPGTPEFGSIARILAPALSRAHFVETRGRANLAGTRTVAGILAYRQRNGTLPDSLDQLGTSAVIDPFTGTPLVYERVGDDFRLYSVSGDGVNDGGVHNPRGMDGEPGDVVFWPRPPKDQ